MRTKHFLYFTFLVFCLLIGGYFYVVDKIIIRDRPIPYSYRQFLLESTKDITGKVIIESGSNSIHSIDPFQLSRYFNAPVVTSAANAGYPIQPKVFNLLSIANKGDIVIFPLEWNQYSYDDQLPDNFLNALADEQLKLEYYFNNLTIWEKIKFAYNKYPLDKAKEGFLRYFERNETNILREDLARLSQFDTIINSQSSESYGNSNRNGPEPIERDGSHNRSCDQYVLGKQFHKGFKITEAFLESLDYLTLLKDKGVRVYFSWPAVADKKSSICYESDEAKAKLDGFATSIRSTVEAKGFKFIGEYQDSHFSSDCFLNTYYHLTKDCAVTRTKKLIDALTKNEVTPFENKEENFLRLISEEVESNRQIISLQVAKKLSPISFESVKSTQLSNKLLLTKGWSSQENWGVWSLGNESEVKFQVDDNVMGNELINITIKGHYYNGPEKTTVFINGKLLGEYQLMNKSFLIPTKDLSGNIVRIEFRHIDVFSPYQLGRSKDNRAIKFGLKEISIK
jgi:hypothetical protein